MKLETFAHQANLVQRTEVERVTYLAFFFLKNSGQTEFCVRDIEEWFAHLHFAQPNGSRLKSKLVSTGVCVLMPDRSRMRLHARTLARLDAELPALNGVSEDIVSEGAILPHALLKGTRGYIERLGDQINASFEHNIFDGCAVLMRRLVEVLLIHAYGHHKIEPQIQAAPDQYKDLKLIISDAISNRTIALTKATKDVLDEFRVLGNFSAHKVIYNCRRDEIKKVSREFRAAVEELLYKSGIRA